MASDLAMQPFTFKIDRAFNLEIKDKYKLMQEKMENLEKD